MFVLRNQTMTIRKFAVNPTELTKTGLVLATGGNTLCRKICSCKQIDTHAFSTKSPTDTQWLWCHLTRWP
jgi:hypothetical protein